MIFKIEIQKFPGLKFGKTNQKRASVNTTGALNFSLIFQLLFFFFPTYNPPLFLY